MLESLGHARRHMALRLLRVTPHASREDVTNNISHAAKSHKRNFRRSGQDIRLSALLRINRGPAALPWGLFTRMATAKGSPWAFLTDLGQKSDLTALVKSGFLPEGGHVNELTSG